MNDAQRFTSQMLQTLQVLRDTIQKLDVPLAQKDCLLGLIRDLREFAYQAGRTEACGSPLGQTVKPGFRYPEEFGKSIRVESQIQQLVVDGLMTDESWHNNAAAHFERVMSESHILLLWIAEKGPAEREYDDMPRYTVELAGKEGTADTEKRQLLATEDTDAVCRFVRQLIEDDLKLSRFTDESIH